MCKHGLIFVFILCGFLSGYGQDKGQDHAKYLGAGGQDGYSWQDAGSEAVLSGKQEVCAGEDVTLTATLKGPWSYRCEWKKKEDAGFSFVGTELKFTAVSTGASGHYYCILTDVLTGKQQQSEEFVFTVHPQPEVALTVSKSLIALGDSVFVEVKGRAEEYTWNVSGISGQSGWMYPEKTTTYRVTGSNGGLCHVTASAEVEVREVYVRLQMSAPAVMGDSIVLRAHTNGERIDWYAREAGTELGDSRLPGGEEEAAFLKRPAVWLTSASEELPASAVNPYGTFIGSGEEITVYHESPTVYTAVSVLAGYGQAVSRTIGVRTAFAGGKNDGYGFNLLDFGMDSLPDLRACVGDSITYGITVNGTSAYRYEWHHLSGGSDVTVGRDTSCLKFNGFTMTDAGQYYCVVTDQLTGAVLHSDTSTFSIFEVPEAEITSLPRISRICAGRPVDLWGNSDLPEVTYVWTANGEVLDSLQAINSVVPEVATEYVVTVINDGYDKCRGYDTAVVNLNTPFIDIPSAITITEGDPLPPVYARDDTGAIADADTYERFEWFLNRTQPEATGVNPLIVPRATSSMERIHVEVMIDGCPASDTTLLKLRQSASYLGGKQDGYTPSCIPPAIYRVEGQPNTACSETDSLELKLWVVGTGLQFKWQKKQGEDFITLAGNTAEMTGTDKSVLKFKPLTKAYSGFYRCVVSNSCGTAVSDTLIVSVKGIPEILSGMNVDRARCINDERDFTFNVKAQGIDKNDPLHYQWWKNGTSLPDTTNYLFVSLNESVNPHPEGTYVVRVSNECGATTDTAYLPVNRPAYVTGLETYSYVCRGSNIDLSVSAGGGEPYYYSLYEVDLVAGDPSRYTVKRTLIDSVQGFSHYLLTNVTQSGVYLWKVGNECSTEMQSANYVYLRVDERPSFTKVPNDTLVCLGQPLTLTCEGSYGTRNKYYWTHNGVVLGGADTLPVLRRRAVTDADSGIYQCYIHNSCTPVGSGAIRVSVRHKPEIVALGSVQAEWCEGDTILLKGALSARWPVDSVRWYVAGRPLQDEAGRITGSDSSVMMINGVVAADGNAGYVLRAYNSCGYTSKGSVQFEVREPARFVRDLNDPSVKLLMCIGTNQSLRVEAEGTRPIRYLWKHDGRVIADGFGEQIDLNDVTADTTGEYTCQIQNMCPDAAITSANIRVSHSDTFRLLADARYCEGQEGPGLTLVGSDTLNTYYLYREGTANPLQQVDGRDVVPYRGAIHFNPVMKGVYTVVARNRDNCENKMPGKVTVTEDPLPKDDRLYVYRHRCEEEATGTLAIDHSQKGVDYYLLRHQPAGWDTIGRYEGNGGRLLMSDTIGLYKVYAVDTLTGCGRTLSYFDSIAVRPYPQPCELTVAGDSTYCVNSVSNVTLVYPCFETGSSYKLYRGRDSINPVRVARPLQWTQATAGVYTIQVTNRWGCSRVFGSQEVVAKPLPEVFELNGGGVFCVAQQDHLLELDNSRQGVKYDFYVERGGGKALLLDTMGTGASLRVRVPWSEGHYFVIAEDTATGCRVPMRDSVDVNLSRLTVTARPAAIYVPYGSKGQLNIDITNGTPPLHIDWDQEAYLSDADTVEDPYTTVLDAATSTRVYTVTVTDASGCNKQASVTVYRTGGKLEGHINRDDCMTTAGDTIRLCTDDQLELCAYAAGGNGGYEYAWSRESGPAGNGRKQQFTGPHSGYVYLEVSSGEQKVRDSVYVDWHTPPLLNGVRGSFGPCIGHGDALAVILDTTTAGADYTLQYCRDNSGVWNDLQTQPGGYSLNWYEPNALLYTGSLRLVADNGWCVRDTVMQMVKQPDMQNFGNGWTYCGNTPVADTFRLSGSEKGYVYGLYGDAGLLTKQKGNGAELTFGGKFPAGTYYVIASDSTETCRDTMNGTALVVSLPLPETPRLLGAGVYCADSCPAILVVADSANRPYSLWIDGADGIRRQISAQVAAAPGDTLDFGQQCAIGTYHIRVYDPLTECEAWSADSISMQEYPVSRRITGDTLYCAGEPGVLLGLDTATLHLKYDLQRYDTAAGTWNKYTPSVVINGRGLPAKVGLPVKAGIYRFYTDLRCASWTDSITVKELPEPDKTLPLQLSGNACADSAFSLKLCPTEQGVEYTLYFQDTLAAGIPCTVTDSSVVWNIYPAVAGTFRVTARRDSCNAVFLNDSVRVDSLLSSVLLEGPERMCENETGELFIASYRPGISYLLRDTSGAAITGVQRNDSVVFAGAGPGIYYAEVRNGSCMTRSNTDTVLPVTAPDTLIWELNDCIGTDEGVLVLRQLRGDWKYVIEGSDRRFPLSIEGYSGDSTYVGLSAGQYIVTASDTLAGCSTSWRDTIRPGVAADSVTGSFAYCEGEAGTELSLSGVHLDVSYSIRDKNGEIVGNVLNNRSNPLVFGTYVADTFFFHKERTGFLGGCSVDSMLIVEERPLPFDSLSVRVTGEASLCAGGTYQVTVEGTQAGKAYELRKSLTVVDTLWGDGGDVTFSRTISEAGSYKVYAFDTVSGCGVYLDTVLNIHSLPRPVTVDSCSYCYDYGSSPLSDSCRIGLRGLSPGVIYSLNDGTDRDTLDGSRMVSGKYGLQPAGMYWIIATDTLTGCRDTVAETVIRAYERPQQLNVAALCITGDTASIALTVPGQDSVRYYVYKDGRDMNTYEDGDGVRMIRVSGLQQTGVYTLLGESLVNGCTTPMKDSVRIEPGLGDCRDTLHVSDPFCRGSREGVTLNYRCSVKGWRYFVWNDLGYYSTDTLAGGSQLIWKKVNRSGEKKPIQEGTYILKAFNACDSVVNIDTVTVTSKPLPRPIGLKERTINFCAGTEFTLELSGREPGVVYTVLLNGSVKETVAAAADTGSIVMGPYSASGKYVIKADKDGCVSVMDSVMVAGNQYPAEKTIAGADKCLQQPGDAVKIWVPNRERKVTYYLYLNGTELVDSLRSSATTDTFRLQGRVGCYTVIAEHENSGCRRPMIGKYCLSARPDIQQILNAGEWNICYGEDTCISLAGSQPGVKYILKRDGVNLNTVTTDTAGPLLLRCVSEPGVYKVLAKAGECETLLSDSVKVIRHDLPPVYAENELHYCAGDYGVTIALRKPTDSTALYTLYSPSGAELAGRYGKTDHDTLVFGEEYTEAGEYVIRALDTVTRCENSTRVKVVIDGLPADFDLSSSRGTYICAEDEGTCTDITLSGSENQTEYVLYKLNTAGSVSTVRGNGSAVTFPDPVCEPGIYYVEARYISTQTQCLSRFGRQEIIRGDTIRRYELQSVKNRYCGISDPSGGEIRLSDSQNGVDYELFRDGLSVGRIQGGTSAALTWSGLKGKMCRELGYADDGYVYTVRATQVLTGCRKRMSGSDTIVEEAPIEILAQEPNEVSITKCEGERVDFNVTTFGCGEHYQWYFNNVPVGEDRDYHNIDTIDPGRDAGIYECVITNTCGSEQMEPVELKIRKRVKTVQPMDTVFVCGPPLPSTLKLTAGFENALRYEWYYVDSTGMELLASGAGSNVYYVIPDFGEAKAGTYVCMAANQCNTVYDTCEVVLGTIPDADVIRGEVADTTLCAGSVYRMEVKTGAGVDIEWYADGRPTGNITPYYDLNPVRVADAGLYTVQMKNACGVQEKRVANVHVDTAITVVDISDLSMIRCKGEQEHLFITTLPAVGVEYNWFQVRDGVSEELVGTGPSYTPPAFTDVSPLTYRVWYKNACTRAYKEIVVNIPQRFSFGDPVREIVGCSDCGRDTVLRLSRLEDAMFASFRWYYHTSSDGSVKELESTADTLRIPLCSGSTGFYYARIFNRCQDSTANTTWIRLDSIPVVRSVLEDDTLCEGTDFRPVLAATGGNLQYEWHILYRDGRDSIFDLNVNMEYESRDTALLRGLTSAEDSAQIWCYLRNTCGETRSDTMLLRIHPWREIRIAEDTLSPCGSENSQQLITLADGDLPWTYVYKTPDFRYETRTVNSRTDTLFVTEAGKYTIVSVTDNSGCERMHDLPGFDVLPNQGVKLTFGEDRLVCWGDTVTLSFSFEGGEGPWRLEIADTAGLVAHIGNNGMLTVSARDTSLSFIAEQSNIYSIYTLLDLGNGCEGIGVDSSVTIIVPEPGHVDFVAGPWMVGQCEAPVNLRRKLQPRLTGGPLLEAGKGMFYVEGARKVNDLWLERDMRGDSCYSVVFEYRDSLNCRVPSDDIRVCVDSLPSGAVVSSDVACESVVNYFELELRPAGRIDSVVIRQARYKKWDSIVNPVVRPSYRTISYGKTQIPSGGLLQVPLNWDEIGGIDSCMTFEVLDIFDSHGCRMNHGISVREYDSLYRDTVWRHWDPVVDVEVRRSKSKPWDRGVHEVNLPEGDSVQVRVTLVKGMPLWSLPTLGVDSIATMDTVFWLKREGVYYFQPKDLSCGRQSTTPPYDLLITHLDTGYFRGRLLLEGVYDESLGDMSWGGCNTGCLSDSLNLPAHLPLLPSHLSVVDWVEVELRVGSNIDSVALMTDSSFLLTRDTCLLLSDGHLADRLTGDTIVGIRNAYGSGSNRRYVAVRHRNHLGVMTSRVYPFVKKTNKRAAAFIDFTKSSTIYLSGVSGNDLNYHMTRKSKDGIVFWLLSAGELNTNSLVTLHDPNRVTWDDMHPTTSSVRVVGYRYDLLHDINLDGCVDWPGWNGTAHTDWLFVQRNRQKFTEVRWR